MDSNGNHLNKALWYYWILSISGPCIVTNESLFYNYVPCTLLPCTVNNVNTFNGITGPCKPITIKNTTNYVWAKVHKVSLYIYYY